MKKVLSLFLAILMILPLSAVAFAADGTITLGTSKTVNIYSDFTEKELTFKPAEDGIYSIEAKTYGECDASIDIYSDDYYNCGLYVGAFSEEDYGSSNYCYFIAKKGVELTVYISGISFMAPDPSTVTFTIKKYNASSAALGNNKCSANETNIFSFIPSKDGYYNFRSSDIKNDPTISIYDYYGANYCNDDIGYDDDLNFDLTVYLTAGEIYLVEVCNYDYEDDLKAFNFTITYNKTSEADYIMSHGEGYVIEITKDDWYGGCVYTVPSGAQYTSNFSASSDNDRVASVYIDSETGEYFITANNPGNATITISAENGASIQLEVKVLSGFIVFLRKIISFIEMIFGMIFSF